LVCKIDQGCKLAVELHPELSIFGYEPDFLDELTEAFGSLALSE